MILYHGSTVEVQQPRILKSEIGRDFGFAFYTTDIRTQAERWARRRAMIESRRTKIEVQPVVSVYEWDEDDAKQLCKQAGLLSPVYEFTDRGGCWFCPNAKLSELRHLYDHHPDLWQKMVRLQVVPGKVTEKFNRSQTFADIDAMFREQDLQVAA